MSRVILKKFSMSPRGYLLMNRGNRYSVLLVVVLLAIMLGIAVQPTVAEVGAKSGILAEAISSDGISTEAGGAVLMEAGSGRVLWQKNAHDAMPMASTTKIFTALAVLRNCDIYDVVAVSDDAVGVEGSSIYLKKGDRFTVYDLLCGLMLRSGNDSAVALAIHCSGSVDAFADCVNDMCSELGLTDTHITNPHGLHDVAHYTSAYDLAVVSSVALQNDTFAEIVSSKSATMHNIVEDTESTIYNKNKLLSIYDGADGVKTGYTKVAGRCYVGSATKEGMQLVSVVLNCYNMWQDSQSMLNYGYNNYTMTNIVPQNAQIRLVFYDKSSVWSCKDNFDCPLNNAGTDQVSTNIVGDYIQPMLQVTVNGEVVKVLPLSKIS